MTFSFSERLLAPISATRHTPRTASFEGDTMSRVGVITGAASGMGLAVARRLGSLGHRVALLDLDGEAAAAAAEDLRDQGTDAIALPVDVTDRAGVDDALAKVRSDLGPVEILVTSAGLDEFRSFTDITAETWERMLAVNLTGTFHAIQAAIPDMIDAGWGRIVTISSSSAQSGAARMAHYVASKGGVIGLTKALAVELAEDRGVTLCGFVRGGRLNVYTEPWRVEC